MLRFVLPALAATHAGPKWCDAELIKPSDHDVNIRRSVLVVRIATPTLHIVRWSLTKILGRDSAVGPDNELSLSAAADDCNSLLQASAAGQPDCHAVRSDSAQSADCSQQLCAVHESASRPTAEQVSSTISWLGRVH